MQTTHVERTIDDLLQWKRRKMLYANPEYQRGAVWDKSQQRRLVDSVMRGYPIPLIYLHHKKEEVAGANNDRFETIDGQQRIEALHLFCENEFKLFDPVADEKKAQFPAFIKEQPCAWAGKSFEQLGKDVQLRFRNTKLPVVIIETHSENEARDLFIRLQAGMPLNAQEKRDAWPGDFTDFILKIGGKPEIERYRGHEFFNTVVNPSKKKRGDCRQLAAQMFMLFMASRESGGEKLCGIDRESIDVFYYKHLTFDSQSTEAQRFKEILQFLWLSLSIGGRRQKKMAGHEAIHLMLLVDSLLDDYTRDWAVNLPDALDSFRLSVTADRKNRHGEYWVEYGQLTQTGSHAAETILHRHRFFAQKMLELLKPEKIHFQ